MFFLDFAQFLNVESLLVDTAGDAAGRQQTEAWDTAELRKQQQRDTVEAFLNADDAGRRKSLAQQSQKRRAEANMIQLHYATVSQDADGIAAANKQLHEELYENKYPGQHQLDRPVRESALAGDLLFNQKKLQIYLLSCCQNNRANPEMASVASVAGGTRSDRYENVAEGGMVDKPNCLNDFYHSCYALSGLSASENLFYFDHKRHFFCAHRRRHGGERGSAGALH
ncbi:hypothetical protein STCU_10695 [Strigomonas culicis]|uniref:Prenyltransferase alpha-alpha toroid domain-containing protein n=1 Tax=Strigomonas culicis TaxID=28005 RepID=S9URS3_9TRYP|nr:hypothetical protein STCU_10695 [Strigomonas culicis]|eukprot:EPY17306.1 hypothetical protein STCU_10695 [Strigomonas culicis]